MSTQPTTQAPNSGAWSSRERSNRDALAEFGGPQALRRYAAACAARSVRTVARLGIDVPDEVRTAVRCARLLARGKLHPSDPALRTATAALLPRCIGTTHLAWAARVVNDALRVDQAAEVVANVVAYATAHPEGTPIPLRVEQERYWQAELLSRWLYCIWAREESGAP